MLTALLGLLVGVVIGGMGGGGGVLTLPVLVYLLGLGAAQAGTASALIVGVTSGIGLLARLRAGLVRWRIGAGLSVAGIPAAALGGLLGGRVAEPVLLLSFAAVTALAAVVMAREALPARRPDPLPAASAVAVRTRPALRRPVLVTVGCGAGIGFLTGFLGVGGGFLAVPVLVTVFRLPMAAAVATSLLVVTVNAVAALTTRSGLAELDPTVVAPFLLAAVAGSLLGKQVADRLSGPALTRAFAVLLLTVGALVGVEAFAG